MLTARGHHLSAAQLAKTNIKALFAKPFSAKEVLAKVEELLGPREDIRGDSDISGRGANAA
jgi:hypothetical protein